MRNDSLQRPMRQPVHLRAVAVGESWCRRRRRLVSLWMRRLLSECNSQRRPRSRRAACQISDCLLALFGGSPLVPESPTDNDQGRVIVVHQLRRHIRDDTYRFSNENMTDLPVEFVQCASEARSGCGDLARDLPVVQ